MLSLSRFFKNKFLIDDISSDFVYFQFLYYVLVFNLLNTFNSWSSAGYLTKESVDNFTAICPPYFQRCLNLYVFHAPPGGYSLGILYAALGVFIFLSLYFALLKQWTKALMLLVVPLLFKVLMMYMFTFLVTGNYTVIEIACLVILLFSSNKFFAFKILLSSLYLFSALIKIYPGYISGDMFNTLSMGLPMLPSQFNGIYPSLLISFFTVSSLLIWHRDRKVRNIFFILLAVFHTYTVIVVSFRFPTICFALLVVSMLASYESFSIKKMIKDKAILFVILFLVLAQTISFFIQGDTHITGEGEKYGFYIFNANKQCVSKKTYIYLDGTTSEKNYSSANALVRCDPYDVWFIAQEECKKKKIASLELEFNLSLDGSPYFKVIDEDNICLVTSYKPFSHNSWLHEGVINKELKVHKNSI